MKAESNLATKTTHNEIINITESNSNHVFINSPSIFGYIANRVNNNCFFRLFASTNTLTIIAVISYNEKGLHRIKNISRYIRITSYNVCYTKLLRIAKYLTKKLLCILIR